MKKMIFSSIAILSCMFATNVFASSEITAEQAKQYQKVGIVSVISATDSPIQLKKIVADEADKQGGKYYVITSEGGNGRLSARADVYK